MWRLICTNHSRVLLNGGRVCGAVLSVSSTRCLSLIIPPPKSVAPSSLWSRRFIYSYEVNMLSCMYLYREAFVSHWWFVLLVPDLPDQPGQDSAAPVMLTDAGTPNTYPGWRTTVSTVINRWWVTRCPRVIAWGCDDHVLFVAISACSYSGISCIIPNDSVFRGRCSFTVILFRLSSREARSLSCRYWSGPRTMRLQGTTIRRLVHGKPSAYIGGFQWVGKTFIEGLSVSQHMLKLLCLHFVSVSELHGYFMLLWIWHNKIVQCYFLSISSLERLLHFSFDFHNLWSLIHVFGIIVCMTVPLQLVRLWFFFVYL